MAGPGVMADFARMPTGRKAFVFIVIGALLFGLYYRFVLKGLREELEEADESHEQSLATNATKDRELKDFEDNLRPQMAKLQEQIDRNQAALPTEAEVPAFFETLQRKIRQSGVSLSKWTQKPEESIESFVKVPVEVEINGTFMQLKKFFASLVQKDISEAASPDERERIVSIESLALSQPQLRDRAIVLAAKFTAVTFRQDNKPAAGKPGGPAPSKAAPAPSPSPSTPPLPSAGTPAGAKARVEDAIDKGGERRVNDADPPSGSGSARLKGGL